jgi:hypothetical protein
MQQLEPTPVLQLSRAAQSASKLSFLFHIFNDSLPYSILADVKLIRYHSKLQVIMFQKHLLTFSILSSTRDSEERLLPGRIEHLPALHETVHASEQYLIALVLISIGCKHHLNGFFCSFTGFKTKLYRHSLFTT